MNNNLKVIMIDTSRKHWKLFYDSTKALFVLDDMLATKYNWYYQELFYVKLVSFFVDSLSYVKEKAYPLPNDKVVSKWFECFWNWRERILQSLSADELIFINYRRHRAAHTFQDGYEYNPNGENKDVRILHENGKIVAHARLEIEEAIRRVTNGYKDTKEWDIEMTNRLHPLFLEMRTELNRICDIIAENHVTID